MTEIDAQKADPFTEDSKETENVCKLMTTAIRHIYLVHPLLLLGSYSGQILSSVKVSVKKLIVQPNMSKCLIIML